MALYDKIVVDKETAIAEISEFLEKRRIDLDISVLSEDDDFEVDDEEDVKKPDKGDEEDDGSELLFKLLDLVMIGQVKFNESSLPEYHPVYETPTQLTLPIKFRKPVGGDLLATDSGGGKGKNKKNGGEVDASFAMLARITEVPKNTLWKMDLYDTKQLFTVLQVFLA